MAGMPDRLIHDCLGGTGVNYKLVWKMVEKKLPPVKETSRATLAKKEG